MLTLFDKLDSLANHFRFYASVKKDFLFILWFGLRGKIYSVILDKIWCQWESLGTELFVPDYISQRIVTSWFLLK